MNTFATNSEGLTADSDYISPERIRAWAGPQEYRNVAARVRDGRCTCCGMGPEEETEVVQLECGHFLCILLCQEREHVCFACALAM